MVPAPSTLTVQLGRHCEQNSPIRRDHGGCVAKEQQWAEGNGGTDRV